MEIFWRFCTRKSFRTMTFPGELITWNYHSEWCNAISQRKVQGRTWNRSTVLTSRASSSHVPPVMVMRECERIHVCMPQGVHHRTCRYQAANRGSRRITAITFRFETHVRVWLQIPSAVRDTTSSLVCTAISSCNILWSFSLLLPLLLRYDTIDA